MPAPTRSNDLGYQPQTLDADTARQRTEAVSSRLLDATGLKGKVTHDRAGASPCFDYDKPVYRMRHGWGVYDLSVDQLRVGLEKLHDALPAQGWKILHYGPDDSPSKSLNLHAEQPEQRYALDVTLNAGKSPGDAPSAPDEFVLTAFVVSQCYRLPEGVDLNTFWPSH